MEDISRSGPFRQDSFNDPLLSGAEITCSGSNAIPMNGYTKTRFSEGHGIRASGVRLVLDLDLTGPRNS